MTIDLDEGPERDDLAHARLLTAAKRLHGIVEILAEGIHRQREDAGRIGESGNISAPAEREDEGMEPLGAVRPDHPPLARVDDCEPDSPEDACAR